MNNNLNNYATGVVAHAGRAVLDAADDFTNEGKAVGEYVKNSLQYTNIHPTVEIIVDQENKSIHIKDDAHGMSMEDLTKKFLFYTSQMYIELKVLKVEDYMELEKQLLLE